MDFCMLNREWSNARGIMLSLSTAGFPHDMAWAKSRLAYMDQERPSEVEYVFRTDLKAEVPTRPKERLVPVGTLTDLILYCMNDYSP